MMPSLIPIVEPSLKARLYERAGRPILSTMSRRSFCRDHFANLVFDSLENLLGGFNPGSGGGPNMELDLPAVDRRKEIAADEHHHACPRARGLERATIGTMSAAAHEIAEQSAYSSRMRSNPRLKPSKNFRSKASSLIACSLMTLAFEQKADDDWGERAR